VNKAITDLNLRQSRLGPVGGVAIGKALHIKVNIGTFHSSNTTTTSFNYETLCVCVLLLQANSTVTRLDLSMNMLDAEAGRVLGEALKVFGVCIALHTQSSAHTSKIYA
jgi:hypothetical protein